MITTHIVSVSQFRSSGIPEKALLRCLPDVSRARILQISNQDNRDRSLLGELLARYAISRFAGIRNQDIDFRYGDKGKPFLTETRGTYFNISHSGDRVACSCSDSETGIDIEHIRKVNFRVAECFFSPSEINDLFSLDGEARTHYFFTLWTIKESFLKAIGTGLTRSLNTFTVVNGPNGFVLTGDELAESFVISSCRQDDYHLAVCAKEPVKPENIETVLPEEMIRQLAPFV